MEKYVQEPLKESQAQKRAQLFDLTQEDSISYALFLKCMKGDNFEGKVNIRFKLKAISSDFFIDYAGTTIKSISINNNHLETQDNYEFLRDTRFLKIPESSLTQGENEISIEYANVYSKDGMGLHSFLDTDGKQYLYSQGELYEIHKIFPCFDQPDLKATLTLTMEVPQDWIAVSNEPIDTEKSVNLNAPEGFQVQAFKTTKRISSYLFAFIAGPYYEIKCQEPYHGTIPMSCYCRESLSVYLKEQADGIFELTKEVLKFYETFFDYPYPFSKYDTIFSPEFLFYAMENAGAVTFDDKYLWREKVTLDRAIERSVLIAHEAAHHWFGNLVTMKWWNDIWLNESFAEFIGYFCLDKIEKNLTLTKHRNIWLTFLEASDWGYSDDQKQSTHPIAGEVSNTDQAQNIFDGITYSKGAVSLKQLLHLIGEENFSIAMSSYFKKYAWSNAGLDDFIDCLQNYYKPLFAGCPANLNDWKTEWFQTYGLNETTPSFNPNSDELIIQQGSALESLHCCCRHHKITVAFFNGDAEIVEEKELVLSNEPKTVLKYDAGKQPKAVLLNFKHEGYLKVRMDNISQSFFAKKVTFIKDELTKGVVWKSFFDLVRDGLLSGCSFVNIALEALPKESSDAIFYSILTYCARVTGYSPKILNKNIIKPKLFNLMRDLLVSNKILSSDRTILLKEKLIRFATYGEEKKIDNITKLIAWFDGTDSELKLIELDLENKWDIVLAIHKHPSISNSQKIEYFNKVASLDQSDTMRLMEKRCEALRADYGERKQLYQSYLDADNELSSYLLEQSMLGYSHSLKYTSKDAEQFFIDVMKVFEERNNDFVEVFFHSLFPPQNENPDWYIQKLSQMIKELDDENDFALRLVMDQRDRLTRRNKGYLASTTELLQSFLDINLS